MLSKAMRGLCQVARAVLQSQHARADRSVAESGSDVPFMIERASAGIDIGTLSLCNQGVIR